jgi:hypothetical protein
MASTAKKKKSQNSFLWVVESIMEEPSYIDKDMFGAVQFIFMGGWFIYLLRGQSLGMVY